ncbi:MAG: WbqC family protein [Candidatus Aminicenantes bacterium]|nr:WbqC family protein [Candidatus Aminicenantes bacterium]
MNPFAINDCGENQYYYPPAFCIKTKGCQPEVRGTAVRISFNQPIFIPWGGFFGKLLHSDKLVLLDDTLLARGFTYVNRNRIKGPAGESWITVPLKRHGRGRQKIKDLEIFEKKKWAKNFLLTVKHFYGKSLFLEPILTEVETILDSPDESFCSMVIRLLSIFKKDFNIDTAFILQSDTGITGKGTSLLVSIVKELGADEVLMPYFSRKILDWNLFDREKIAVHFLRYDPPQYPQFWGHFLKRLSVLDLLLCCGGAGRTVIEKGSYLYEAAALAV